MEKCKCSNCNKMIDADAVKCPFCGVEFEEDIVASTPKKSSPAKPVSMEKEFEIDTLTTCKYLKDLGNAYILLGVVALVVCLIGGAIMAGQYDGSIVFMFIVAGAIVFFNCIFKKYIFQWMSCLLKGTYLIYKKK